MDQAVANQAAKAAPATPRRAKETGVPDNKQFMHPTLLRNYGNWKYHDRPMRVIDFFADNALEHERTGEMIERIGLSNFLEGIGIDADPNMVSTPRTNPFVRMDGWDEEVAKINAKKAA